MREGSPVGAHVIKMMGYIQTLQKLGFPLKNELATDVILQSLSNSFKLFILNFNMNEINKTLPQLLAAFTLNCVPSKSVQKTPYEMWTRKRPNMSFMEVWDCKAYVKNQMSTKLEPKSHLLDIPKKLRDIIFQSKTKQSVCCSNMSLSRKRISLKERDRRNIELEEVQQQQVDEPEVEQISQVVEENSTDLETQPLRRSTRERHMPERHGFLVTTHRDVILVDQDKPKTYQEAVSSPDSEKWLEAMRSEMDSMLVNQTYKGRLVAKGFRQIHGVDYDETFSSVAMFKSIKILLAIAAFHDYEIWQMDVKTTFLNGKLEEDVFMTQPKGFVSPKNARKVCKLQRSIYGLKQASRSYGLKQASRSWNLCFNDAINKLGFIKNEDEPCVYKKVSGSIVSFLIFISDAKTSIVITMEPLRKQSNPDLIKDPNIFLSASISSDDNVVDPLTRPLTQQKHDHHTNSLGIRYVSDWS
ncbi:hypothetical protein V6N13_042658 [Hibiscus sabdariffa]